MSNLQSPTTYQGAKQRIAKQIVDIINDKHANLFDLNFYDLCCGSGAISIELLNRGFPAQNLYMVDKGPWGHFWQNVSQKLSLDSIKSLINEVPQDKSKIQSFVKALSLRSASIDTTATFIVLQACSFGGKAIWIDNDKWQNTSFRSYWLPTPTSNRQSPVNPMMPMPDTLLERVLAIYESCANKIHAYCCDINEIEIKPNSVVYVDPPYVNTTSYGHDINWDNLPKPCFVSEGYALSNEAWCISTGRKKGGISGERKNNNIHQEWLSYVS